jgi:hypothetical protein
MQGDAAETPTLAKKIIGADDLLAKEYQIPVKHIET